jgi:hypothetical protein
LIKGGINQAKSKRTAVDFVRLSPTLLQKGVQRFNFARFWWRKAETLHSKTPFLQGSHLLNQGLSFPKTIDLPPPKTATHYVISP